MQAREGIEGFSLPGGRFQTTRWSVVLSAGDLNSAEAEAAREALCVAYWQPVYAYIRRQGRTPTDAEDLTQEFFARLLEKNYVVAFRPEFGRFRVFLLTAVKRFLSKEWDRTHALKRGGAVRFVSLDARGFEECHRSDAGTGDTPESLFERRWALVLLGRVLERVRADYARAGRDALFQALKDRLVDRAECRAYAAVASSLGMNEPAVKQAVHRLRLRYRDRLVEEIAHTVSSPEEVEDELRHLLRLLSH